MDSILAQVNWAAVVSQNSADVVPASFRPLTVSLISRDRLGAKVVTCKEMPCANLGLPAKAFILHLRADLHCRYVVTH
jgi:hypothetical protein